MAERPVVCAAMVAGEEKGTQLIKINGYSQNKELLETGKHTTSIPFSVGGHNWAVRYFPNGRNVESAGYISVFLVLESANAKNVRVKFSSTLLDKDGIVPLYKGADDFIFRRKGSSQGIARFASHEDLEGSVYLTDDSIRIKCEVTVKMKIRIEETKSKQYVAVPPTNLHQHLGDLLKSMDGADVTFQVGGERFLAHRTVLAARSSVFKAELFGVMKGKTGSLIEIDDMESGVFKSLLHFIYTDSLPMTEVVKAGHLLVAADRYSSGQVQHREAQADMRGQVMQPN